MPLSRLVITSARCRGDALRYEQHLNVIVTMASTNLPSYSLLQSLLVQLHDKVDAQARLAIEALSEAVEQAVSLR